MRSNINFILARWDIPPVSVYIETGQTGYPTMPRRDENIPARRDRMKIPCKRKLKIIRVSIGSRGIPAMRDILPRRDILAKRDYVKRPLITCKVYFCVIGYSINAEHAIFVPCIENFRLLSQQYSIQV